MKVVVVILVTSGEKICLSSSDLKVNALKSSEGIEYRPT